MYKIALVEDEIDLNNLIIKRAKYFKYILITPLLLYNNKKFKNKQILYFKQTHTSIIIQIFLIKFPTSRKLLIHNV